MFDEHLEKDMKAAVNRKVQCPVQLSHFSYTIYKTPCLLHNCTTDKSIAIFIVELSFWNELRDGLVIESIA